jgi:hypothetical protein
MSLQVLPPFAPSAVAGRPDQTTEEPKVGHVSHPAGPFLGIAFDLAYC